MIGGRGEVRPMPDDFILQRRAVAGLLHPVTTRAIVG
jgi:hypothetical protein